MLPVVAYMMWELRLQDAVEQGRQEERMAFALKLLKRNRPLDQIVKATGLTHEEIERLRTGR